MKQADTPTGASTEQAEALYLAIYEAVAAKADYLQPDGHRQMLPEAAVAAAVAAALSGIVSGVSSGFLKKLGEKAAEYVAKLIGRIGKKDATTADRVAVAAELVPMIVSGDVVTWDEITASVTLELTRIGFSLKVSRDLAAAITESIRRNVKAPG